MHRLIMVFYAVKRGKIPGVYQTWAECQNQVKNFPKCMFKKFDTKQEAETFISGGSSVGSTGLQKRKMPSEFSDAVDDNTAQKDADPSSSCTVSGKQKPLQYAAPKKPAFYAVHRGERTGVFQTWTECESQIANYRNASYKKFATEEEAAEFVKTGRVKKVNESESKKIKINEEYSTKDCLSIKDIVLDPLTEYNVFTDGASARNGANDAAAGIGVYWGPNHPLNASMRLAGRQTNNRAEIYAATYALKQAKQFGANKIKLHTDSQFLIKGITEWIKNWKKNGWVNSKGETVINKDDFIQLEKAKEGLDVEFIYIKAHASLPGNTEADRLAVEGAKKEEMDAFVIPS